MTTANIALVKRYLDDCWSDGQIEHASEYFSDNFIAHDPNLPDNKHGYEHIVRACEQFLQAFPVISIQIKHLFAFGDRVVVHWTHRGKHVGPLFGHAPTNKEATLEGIAIFRIADNKIVETWEVANALQLLQELGLMTGDYPVAFHLS